MSKKMKIQTVSDYELPLKCKFSSFRTICFETLIILSPKIWRVPLIIAHRWSCKCVSLWFEASFRHTKSLFVHSTIIWWFLTKKNTLNSHIHRRLVSIEKVMTNKGVIERPNEKKKSETKHGDNKKKNENMFSQLFTHHSNHGHHHHHHRHYNHSHHLMMYSLVHGFLLFIRHIIICALIHWALKYIHLLYIYWRCAWYIMVADFIWTVTIK